MLRKLIGHKFQSHKNVEITFSPHVTGLIGISNSGKTSIIRLLKWIATNKPTGTSFRNNTTEKGTVSGELILQGNTRVKLSKKGSGVYTITDSKGKAHEFKKFGAQVPDEVKEVLNLDDINFASQLDAPFLITSSPPEIARSIGRLTGTDKIEKAIKKINSWVADYRSERKVLIRDIDEIKTQLGPLKKLDDIAEDIVRLKKIRGSIISLAEEHEQLLRLQTDIATADHQIKEDKKVLENKKLINNLKSVGDRIDELEEEATLMDEIALIDKQIDLVSMDHYESVGEYIKMLKKNKTCPTCFTRLTPKKLRKIKYEIFATK